MTTEPKITEADVRREFAATGAEPVIRFLRARGLIAEETVDPLLVEAAKVCAAHFEAQGYSSCAAEYQPGGRYFCEGDEELSIALAALRRGMELGRSDRSEALAALTKEPDA